MLYLHPQTRIFLYPDPTDMRRSFNGLSALVYSHLEKDPLGGDLFLFRNRRGNCLKILFWDRTGLCLWYKKLERGTFRWPLPGEKELQLDVTGMMLLLEGLNPIEFSRSKRFFLKKVQK